MWWVSRLRKRERRLHIEQGREERRLTVERFEVIEAGG